jgi:hypothetical protein
MVSGEAKHSFYSSVSVMIADETIDYQAHIYLVAFRTIPVPHSPGGLQLKNCNSCKHFRKLFCVSLSLMQKHSNPN